MTFQLLDVVVLARDRPEDGLIAGDPGTIVEIHAPDAIAVEFVNPSGRTKALVILQPSDIREAGDPYVG